MKIIKDTLQIDGKFSIRRLMTFSAFWVATIYAFLPLFMPTFEVKEFVFLGFLGAGGFSLFRTQQLKTKIEDETIT